jgi:hypothetical protein
MKIGRLLALAMLASPAIAQPGRAASDPGPVAPAIGPGWEMIDGDSATQTFLDLARATRRRGVVRARLLSINERDDARGASAASVVLEIDCRSGAGTVVDARRYRFDGSRIDGGIVPAAERERRVPPAGSRDARLATRLCGHASRSRSPETILIRFRQAYAICNGNCPDFETRIGPTGWVVSHQLHRREVRRFRVARPRLANFLAILDTLRPAGELRLDDKCQLVTVPDGAPDPLADPRPDDMDVRWIGPAGSARLTSCAFSHREIRRKVENALNVLGVDPYSGGPHDHMY